MLLLALAQPGAAVADRGILVEDNPSSAVGAASPAPVHETPRADPMPAPSVKQGANRQRLLALVERMQPLALHVSHGTFSVGETLRLRLDLPRAGWLNLINIDARDNVLVLFPNVSAPANRLGPGPVALPGEPPAFDLVAGPPDGPTLLVAILSPRPLNLFAGADDRGDTDSRLLGTYAALSTRGLRRLDAEAAVGGAFAAAVEVLICPPTGCARQSRPQHDPHHQP